MAKLRHFNSVVKEYADLADFRIVYIREAHPADGWAFRNNYDIKKPACPVLVDDIHDESNYAYGGFPERLYIVLDSRVVYAGHRGPAGYVVKEVEDWLAAFRKSQDGGRANGKA
nr:hypothetical protein BaRGS_034843 [Batillaria attramentaria]